jgi:hypothetical protein
MRYRVSNMAMKSVVPDDATLQSALRDSANSKQPRRDAKLPLSDTASRGQANVRILRVWRRARTHIEVELLTGAGRQHAVIRDISQFGAGLAGPFTLTKRERVTLRLANGREVSAQVRWRLHNRCGVSFLDPLDSTDPLIRGTHPMMLPPSSLEFDTSARGAAPQTAGVLAGTLSVVANVLRGALRLLGSVLRVDGGEARQRRAEVQRSRDLQMLRRACRKQGYSWLAGDEVDADEPHPMNSE